MRLVQIGDVSVTPIGLGGYEMGPEGDESPDLDRAIRVIQTSIDAGINWLDTAEVYHATKNETLIGEAIAKSGLDIAVASKVMWSDPPEPGASGFRPEQVHAACRASLSRLGRDVLDVYYLHWPDESGVPLEETWGAMTELADEGLVRSIGMSNYGIEDIRRCHGERRVDALQTGLSMLDYLDSRELVRQCGELDIPVVVYEPLASGLLSDKTLDEVRGDFEGYEDWEFYTRLLAPGKGEQSFVVTDGLRAIAHQLGATVAQVALAWVLDQPGVTAALAGSLNGGHMAENAGAVELDLSSVRDELEALIPLGPAFN